MKQYILTTIIVLGLSFPIFSQVGIGTTSPKGALDVESGTYGVVYPSVALTSTAIAAPVVNANGSSSLAIGTTVYNTNNTNTGSNDVHVGIYSWDGSKWVWDHHTNPAGVPLRYQSGCTALDGAQSRVYVVGTNFKIYEKYWSWPSWNRWMWRTIGSPPGTSVSFFFLLLLFHP